MSLRPTALRLEGNDLVIQWSDGQERKYTPLDLRCSCPCATCNTARGARPGEESQPLSVEPEVTIRQMAPVGNYAYKISFSDGHDTGIYTLELLRRLGRGTAEGE